MAGAGFSSLLQAVEGNFETNLPQDQVLALASAMGGDWQVETYTASGYSAYRETYSMPGQELYVILPDQASVEQGRGPAGGNLGGLGPLVVKLPGISKKT